MTMKIQRSVTIGRSLSDVALYVMRLEHEQDYWPGVKSVRLVSGTPGHVGVTYERVFEAMGGEQTTTVSLVEHQPGRRLVVQSAPGVVQVRGVLTFEPQEEGTQLNVELEVRTKWFLAFSQARVRKNIEENLTLALDNLKGLLEARRTSGTKRRRAASGEARSKEASRTVVDAQGRRWRSGRARGSPEEPRRVRAVKMAPRAR